MSFKITWKVHVVCFILSIIIIAAVYKLLRSAILYTVIYIMPRMSVIPSYVLLLLYIIVLSSVVTLIHEFIHGAAYKIFGGKVKYGIKLIYAYTMETSGIPLSRTKFLIILLSPLIIISVLSMVIGYQIGALAFIFNFAGSTGDMLMALYLLLRVKKNHSIIDRIYGFDVVSPQVKNTGTNLSV